MNDEYEVKLARLASILTMIEYRKTVEKLTREDHSLQDGLAFLRQSIEEVHEKNAQSALNNKAVLKELKQIAALTLRAMVEFGLKKEM